MSNKRWWNRGPKPPQVETVFRKEIENPSILLAKGQAKAEADAGIVRERSAYGRDGDIDLAVSPQDRELAMRIAMRGAEFMRAYGVEEDLMTACMDICAIHRNQQPLKLLEFAITSDVTDFAHDYAMIRKHINRTTGRLNPEAGDGKALKFADLTRTVH